MEDIIEQRGRLVRIKTKTPEMCRAANKLSNSSQSILAFSQLFNLPPYFIQEPLSQLSAHALDQLCPCWSSCHSPSMKQSEGGIIV